MPGIWQRRWPAGWSAGAKPIVLKGPLTEVIDGDTVTIRMGSHEYRIRLHGIDCPESDQPFGDEASNTLAAIVDSDNVQCRLTDVDRYGRLVGVLSVRGKPVNLELVEAGMAWWYSEYSPDDEQLAAAQEEARAAKRGLWADPGAVAPWEWTKRN
jgi:micrococcal nuclease